MKSITGLPKKIVVGGPAHIIIEQIMIFNHMNDLDNFSMCLDDLRKDTDRYAVNSDWYATYLYAPDGVKKLGALTCLNLTHPEFDEDDKKSIHLSAIEVDPKYRDSILETPLHIFSSTVRALKASAKKAGYGIMTLQAKDVDKVPKYEHLGFEIMDLSDKDDYKEFLSFYKEHPMMETDL